MDFQSWLRFHAGYENAAASSKRGAESKIEQLLTGRLKHDFRDTIADGARGSGEYDEVIAYTDNAQEFSQFCNTGIMRLRNVEACAGPTFLCRAGSGAATCAAIWP